MTDDTPHEDAGKFAEDVHRQGIESEDQRRRLEGAPTEQIRRVLRDGREPPMARANALLMLLTRRDPELPEILLGLFDDPDPIRS